MSATLLFSSSRSFLARTVGARALSSAAGPIATPPMVYISGEEMTNYTMDLIQEKWVKPFLDTSSWEYFDLSCVSRDSTKDKVLHDAVEAGARIGSIFKEPTVTPTLVQKEKLGLSQAWGSPNGAMRRGWNGITISRDTIHIEGMELGYKRPVLFERHAVGGEYAAGYDTVGKGTLRTVFYPQGEGGTEDWRNKQVVDERSLSDEENAVVTYHNPLDNVEDLAHHFFSRTLAAGVTPYVVTKKTVFKWQEPFWTSMKQVFDEHYKEKFLAAGLTAQSDGELQHVISDAATMQIIRWTDGGFGMAAHNYDGDMLTDEVAQVHRSPGFLNSVLLGKAGDGRPIKEFEASHGTVADMWDDHLAGKETSLNPLGMVEALLGAIDHSSKLAQESEDASKYDHDAINDWVTSLRSSVHEAMVAGKGTRDLCGPAGLTTEDFVDHVASELAAKLSGSSTATPAARKLSRQPSADVVPGKNVDLELMEAMFRDLDTDGNGTIDFEEFSRGLIRLGVQPKKFGF